jgi:hypothetical protein
MSAQNENAVAKLDAEKGVGAQESATLKRDRSDGHEPADTHKRQRTDDDEKGQESERATVCGNKCELRKLPGEDDGDFEVMWQHREGLRRYTCGFGVESEVDHSKHADDEVGMLMLMPAFRLSTVLGMAGIEEISGGNSEYAPFFQVSEGKVGASSPLDEVRDFLFARLGLSDEWYLHPRIERLPTSAEHDDQYMVLYPTHFDGDEMVDAHRRATDIFKTECQEGSCFFFAGADDCARGSTCTYPVIYAGFNEDNNIIGVLAIRTDS